MYYRFSPEVTASFAGHDVRIAFVYDKTNYLDAAVVSAPDPDVDLKAYYNIDGAGWVRGANESPYGNEDNWDKSPERVGMVGGIDTPLSIGSFMSRGWESGVPPLSSVSDVQMFNVPLSEADLDSMPGRRRRRTACPPLAARTVTAEKRTVGCALGQAEAVLTDPPRPSRRSSTLRSTRRITTTSCRRGCGDPPIVTIDALPVDFEFELVFRMTTAVPPKDGCCHLFGFYGFETRRGTTAISAFRGRL